MEHHFTCEVCDLKFHGADSGMQYQNHIATAHANSHRPARSIRPAPPSLIPNQKPDHCFKQINFIGLPITFLVPPGHQESNVTEIDSSSSSQPEAQMTSEGIQDTEVIVPHNMADDESEDLDWREDGSRNGERDRSQPVETVDVAASSIEVLWKTKRTPSFMSELITEVKPGEYLYRGKIPFYYKDNLFTCGRCESVIRQSHNMKRHLKICEVKALPPRRPKLVQRKNGTPESTNDLVIEVKPGEYLYREKIPFYGLDKRFTCGQCKKVICGSMFNMRRHLRTCDNSEKRLKDPPPQSTQSAVSQPAVIVPEVHYSCHICGLQFVGADSGIQCKTHITTAHANGLRPILPAPSGISVQNSDMNNCSNQTGIMGLPVSILLVPPPQQQPNVTENSMNRAEAEAEAAVVETEDAGLIVPDVMNEEVDDLDHRDSDNGIAAVDPLQLMKIDFDYLQDEMNGEDAEELLGS